MKPKHVYYFMLSITAVTAIMIILAVIAGNIKLTEQSKTLTNSKAETKAVDDQKIALAQAKKDLRKYSELNEIAKSVVPLDKDQAKTILEINSIAEKSGVAISLFGFDPSTLGQKASAAGAKNAPDTQVKPVPGIDGVYSLEITVTSSKSAVSYDKFIKFLEGLETNRRTAHVTSISVVPSVAGNDVLVNFTVKLNAYMRLKK